MPAASAATRAPALLELRRLHKRYADAQPALVDIDLRLGAGEVIGLIGPSGAGKSTLIRCVNRLVEPTAGQVLFGGQDVRALSHSEMRRVRCQIGMVFQNHALIDRLTVMENVLSGRLGSTGFWRSWFRRFMPRDIGQAYRLLARLGLGGLENQRADALSGGQRQRVGLARALIQQPRLLLVDEPTASLDPRSSRETLRLLLELCREHGIAAIVSSHDVRLATELLPRIVGLRAGTVVYDGIAAAVTPAELDRIYGRDDESSVLPPPHLPTQASPHREASALDVAME